MFARANEQLTHKVNELEREVDEVAKKTQKKPIESENVQLAFDKSKRDGLIIAGIISVAVLALLFAVLLISLRSLVNSTPSQTTAPSVSIY